MKRISSIECEGQLEKLHLDHTYDVACICKVWSEALLANPKAWDEGICGPKTFIGEPILKRKR